ncbi:oligosaccharide repeat unit polymerase [Escherichia coli]
MVEISCFILVLFNFLTFMYLLLRNKSGVFYTLWVIFVIWFFSFPSYMQYSYRIFPWANYPKDTEIIFSNLITFIFSVFLFAGYIISYKKINNHNLQMESRLCISNVANVVTLLLMIPSVFFIAIVGVSSFFMGRSFVGELVYSDGFLPMLYAASKFGAFGILAVYLVLYIKKPKNQKFGLFSTLMFILAIIINFIVNNPLSSPRFHFLSMALAILVIFRKIGGRLSSVALFLASPFLLFIVFPLVKHLGETSGDYNKYGLSEYLVKGVDFDSFQQLVNITRFVTDKGYSWGENFVAGIGFFIPRSIWQTKPTNLGILAAEHQGYFYTNLSAPLVGEFYYAGDIIGIIIGALAVGLLTGKTDSVLNNSKLSASYFIGLWISSFSFIIFRGAFGSVAPMMMLGLCASLVLYISIIKTNRTPNLN